MLIKKKKFRKCIYKKSILLLKRKKKIYSINNKKAYCYISKSNAFISPKQTELLRRVVNLVIEKKHKNFIKPLLKKHKLPYTKKPMHSRMGKGKASITNYYCKLYKHTKFYNVNYLYYADIKGLCYYIQNKLGIILKPYFKYHNIPIHVNSFKYFYKND
jgi:ribosomal protein L16/L10AE